ncbi:MAG TPA: DUF1684 domain-containing protein [Steroidobacteraceae bacterium]|nr:DUF1684 domain-containing protein [Steroidobacteraceae bacterium]
MLPVFARYTVLAVSALFAFTHVAAQGDAKAPTAEQERGQIEQWRTQRVANLTSPTGWLTLSGLYWLKEGDNTFGSGEANSLVLKHASLPATLGTFQLRGKAVTFATRTGSRVTQDGKAVDRVTMILDSAEKPTVLEAGSIQFIAIERAGKIGARVRDTLHPARRNFKGIDYFPIDANWAIDAKFEPYSPARKISIVNILGMTEPMVSPGAIVFSKNGKQYRLETVLELPDDKELFIMFADATTARETYGAGRYLYIPMPKDGRTRIDFQQSVQPAVRLH